MSTKSKLDDWLFLLGDWKGQGKLETVTEEMNYIDSSATFTLELGGKAIMGLHKATQGAKIINESIGILFYDVLNETYRRKSFFSYGFVNNEVAYESSPHEIRFTVESEPLPPQFRQMRWRSYITKVSPTTILLGLEQSKKGGDFKLYTETRLDKIA